MLSPIPRSFSSSGRAGIADSSLLRNPPPALLVPLQQPCAAAYRPFHRQLSRAVQPRRSRGQSSGTAARGAPLRLTRGVSRRVSTFVSTNGGGYLGARYATPKKEMRPCLRRPGGGRASGGRFWSGLTKGFGFDLGHALDRAGTYASWGNRTAKKLQKGTSVLATKN